ncbi:peptidoglycan DD-metalloendopeptidase family protein [Nocardioides sp.]|uniref:peptidoglycan DD-metalloendopeptidase family protein n=1 Tax=Nocardioides sp. TaxID=35761 RepID=UPI003516DB7C
MGNHRAEHGTPGRRVAAPTPGRGDESPVPYVGKRVARPAASSLSPDTPLTAAVNPPAPLASPAASPSTSTGGRRAAAVVPTLAVVPATSAPLITEPAPAPRGTDRAATVELPALHEIDLTSALTDSSTTLLRPVKPAGKRRAERHADARGPLLRGLPSLPVAAGVATLAVAVGGAVVSGDPQLVAGETRLAAANAMTGSFGTASVGERLPTVSRASDRDTLGQATGTDLVAQAEQHAEERNSALGKLAKAAEKEAADIALNRWVLPLKGYRLTATFGEYGLWSSYHTGLDFAAPTGTAIYAVSNGTVTSAEFAGAYGNRTVITLDDGTELWFCHQSRILVSPGDKVRAGEQIGNVGSTGHVTGPHLHLEVRPGGGDPVDPDAALRQHGVTP